MADIVNTGQAANDGTGDPLRTAFGLINQRFQELLGTLSQITWAPGLAIEATPARQWTVVGGQAYVATSNHTAGATFAADLADGRWLAVDVAQLMSDLNSTAEGEGADLVRHRSGATVGDMLAALANTESALSAAFPIGGAGFTDLVEQPIAELAMGFNNGTTDTQVFPGAQLAHQGICYVEVGGVQKLFMSAKVNGTSYTTAERHRIVEFNYPSGTPVAWSQEIHIGHGQDISPVVDSGQLYFITTSVTEASFPGDEAGKGYSKIRWRGVATDQTDVSSFKLLGQTGSGHPLAIYRKATPCATRDGSKIVLVCHESETPVEDVDASDDNSRTVLVFDRATVEAAGDPLTVQPLSVFRLPRRQPSLTETHTIQGVCADDKYIYVLGGYYQPRAWHLITMVDYAGNLVRQVPVAGPRADYGLSNLLNHPTLGIPVSMEPEGLTFGPDGSLLWSTTDNWKTGGAIVSFDGQNFANISGSTGVAPYRIRNWTPTTKAATAGAWDAATTYTNGPNFTRRSKMLYALKRPTGAAGERPLDAGVYAFEAGATMYGGQNAVDLAWPRGDAYQARAYEPLTNTYHSAFGYHGERRIQIHDHRAGSDSNKFVSIQAGFDAGREFMMLLPVGASQDLGAWCIHYGNSDSVAPGDTRWGSGGATARMVLSAGGTLRPGTSDTQDLGTTATKWNTVNARYARLGSSGLTAKMSMSDGSPEGSVTGNINDWCLNTAGTAGTVLYKKTSGTGNTGWNATI
jgi:hypothetical protein